MLGRKKSSGSTVSDYINELITGHLGQAAAGHNIELAIDNGDGRLSLIFDEVRVYFNAATVDPGVGVMEMQAPIFLNFAPSSELIGEVMLTNKSFVSINLIPIDGTNFDLVISVDLLLTGHAPEDAINLAVLLSTIAVTHEELYDRWEAI